MRLRNTLTLSSIALLSACGANGGDPPSTGRTSSALSDLGEHGDAQLRHVLLISVDGLHEVDVENWIQTHPASTFAALASSGIEYSDAHTSVPSDSFPGLLALVTGGTPKSTGVYYDDSYDRTLFPPGSACQGNPGTEIVYDESIDHDSNQLFSGGIDPSNLPLRKDVHGACTSVYPHEFIHVNTIFEVIRAAGGHTAWSDKHPAYDLVNGPSGSGVEDLYAPEINSLIVNGGTANGVDLSGSLALCNPATNSLALSKVTDYTTCEPATQAYDDTKVQAVLNEIDGRTSDGSRAAPVPAVFGMNFQAVSVAQKLPVGGYQDAAGTPGALLATALDHVDASLGRMLNELETRRLDRSTLIVVSAKHGQSPIDSSQLAMEGGGHAPIQTVQDPLGPINAADPTVDDAPSAFVNPNSGNNLQTHGHLQTDDVGIVWLQDQSAANVAAVVSQLQANAGPIFADVLPPGTPLPSNITSGNALATLFGDPTSGDRLAAARAPNVFIQPNHGVIYSGSSKKIAEHGGAALDDTHVALLVSSRGWRSETISTTVSTTQVAPTILRALGIEPRALDAVRVEHTRALPGIDF